MMTIVRIIYMIYDANNKRTMHCQQLKVEWHGISGITLGLGHLKSLDFVLGPFRILDMAPFSDFQGLISQCPATFTAQLHSPTAQIVQYNTKLDRPGFGVRLGLLGLELLHIMFIILN